MGDNKVFTTALWPELTRYRAAAQNMGLGFEYFPAGTGIFGIRVVIPEGREKDWTAELRRPDLLDGLRAP